MTRDAPAPRRGDGGAFSLVVLAAFALAWFAVALLRGLPAWVGWLYAGASLLAFVLYAVDKSAAAQGRDRIPESTLLAIGTVGGWPGAIVAQRALRHKTIKRSFRLRFWLTVVAHVALVAAVLAALSR